MYSKPKSISLTHEQIVEDLAALNNNPEHRNKLYLCIDDKIPENRAFTEMDNILKDSEKLKEVVETLKDRLTSLHSLSHHMIADMYKQNKQCPKTELNVISKYYSNIPHTKKKKKMRKKKNFRPFYFIKNSTDHMDGLFYINCNNYMNLDEIHF
ncbi:hypothetical protein FQR65_LT08357 [Abscondita terminalis]|nr:hypothetical protein FQR65_LT08357 [Abscondita terminalis]